MMVHMTRGNGEVLTAATCDWVMGLKRGDAHAADHPQRARSVHRSGDPSTSATGGEPISRRLDRRARDVPTNVSTSPSVMI